MNKQHSFNISVHDLERQPGAAREISREFVMGDGIRTPMIAIEGSCVSLEARLESVHDGVLITGTVRAQAAGQCSRCLRDMTQQIEADIQELYFYPEHEPQPFSAAGVQEALSNIISDNYIDVESLVRSELVLQLPFTPVCDDDCLGICAECGQILNEGYHSHDSDDTDPRWEMLKKFKF